MEKDQPRPFCGMGHSLQKQSLKHVLNSLVYQGLRPDLKLFPPGTFLFLALSMRPKTEKGVGKWMSSYEGSILKLIIE